MKISSTMKKRKGQDETISFLRLERAGKRATEQDGTLKANVGKKKKATDTE